MPISLIEAIEEAAPVSTGGRPCPVGRCIKANEGQPGVEELRRQASGGGRGYWTQPRLAAVITANGFQVSASRTGSHRRQECNCSLETGTR